MNTSHLRVTRKTISANKISRCLLRLVPLGYGSGQGWRSGESIHLPPMWPGFDSQIWRHMWDESLRGEGKPEYRRKPNEDNQQTQPKYDAESGN